MRLIDVDELSKWILGQIKSPSCPKYEIAFGLRIMKHSDRMPSVQPERKTGRWLETNVFQRWKCSECGEATMDAVMGEPRANYCPNCGAKMKEGGQE